MSVTSATHSPGATLPVAEIFRLLLGSRDYSVEFTGTLLNFLAKEKAGNFRNVNFYLENIAETAPDVLEEVEAFQAYLESLKTTKRDLQREYADLKGRVDGALKRLHAAKAYLDNLKIALCRFIIQYEAPRHAAPRKLTSLEEYMDAATLAEMRLSRNIKPDSDAGLQRFLALYMTFRSIVCSYNGPSYYIAQLESATASMDAIYQKVKLEMEVFQATRKLMETRQELTSMRFNLNALQSQLMEQKLREEKLKELAGLQEKSGFSTVLLSMAAVLIIVSGVALFLFADVRRQNSKVGPVISQRSCLEIQKQLEASPRYKSQVLIFRKFGHDIYFKANHLTCEKLHRLDANQLVALAQLLKDDYEAGNRESGTFNGHRVLQVKDVGINKLVVKLANPTEGNPDYKLKVLERATNMQAVLHREEPSEPDLLIVNLAKPGIAP